MSLYFVFEFTYQYILLVYNDNKYLLSLFPEGAKVAVKNPARKSRNILGMNDLPDVHLGHMPSIWPTHSRPRRRDSGCLAHPRRKKLQKSLFFGLKITGSSTFWV
jgi:hypothetical protein